MKIIQFPFKKVLTKRELNKLNKRVDEISNIIDLCDDNKDSDIIDNLCLELESIVATLEQSKDNLLRKAN